MLGVSVEIVNDFFGEVFYAFGFHFSISRLLYEIEIVENCFCLGVFAVVIGFLLLPS